MTEAQQAYRQIQRFRNSSSPLLILLIFAFPLGVWLNQIPGHHQDIHPPTGPLVLGVLFVVGLHALHYCFLKKQSGEAQEKLNLMRYQYGPEIDILAKGKSSFWLKMITPRK